MQFTGTKSSPWILLLLRHKISSWHGGFLIIALYYYYILYVYYIAVLCLYAICQLQQWWLQRLSKVPPEYLCYGTVLFLGDFNCDIYQTKCNDDRSKSLSLFLETIQMSTRPLEDCYTFWPTHTILDYVITDTYQHDLLTCTCSKVIDEDICVVLDQLPIYKLLKCEIIMYSLPQSTNVAWNRCKNEQLISYQQINCTNLRLKWIAMPQILIHFITR